MDKTGRLAGLIAARVREFWGDALDLDSIRYVDSSIARTTGRAFVTWNTIHWPGPPPTDPDDPAIRILMHELTHCWQHQTGRRQLARGLVEQILYTLLGWWRASRGLRPWYDPYDYGGAPGVAAAERLDDFRLEAQATIVEHHWAASVAGLPAVAPRSDRVGALTHEDGSPTAYARDLERLCRAAGIGSSAGPPVARLSASGEDERPPADPDEPSGTGPESRTPP
jgi:hypothetical protein